MVDEQFSLSYNNKLFTCTYKEVISLCRSGRLSPFTLVYNGTSNEWESLSRSSAFRTTENQIVAALKRDWSKPPTLLAIILSILLIISLLAASYFMSFEWLKLIKSSDFDWARTEYVSWVENEDGVQFYLFKTIGKSEPLPVSPKSYFQPQNGFLVYQASNNLWGFYKIGSKNIPPPEYEYLLPFSEKVTAVKIAGKWGYIDQNSKLIINPRFDDAHSFSSGVATVALLSKDNLVKTGWHIIDKTGRIITNEPWDYLGNANGGLIPAYKNGKWGYLNLKGHIAIPIEYLAVLPFSEEVAAVLTSEGWTFIDKSGKRIFTKTWDNAWSFTEGIAAVAAKNKWGFIDSKGKRIIDYEFDDARPFAHGLAAVAIAGKWGLINKEGKFIVKPHFDTINAYDGMYAIASEKGYIRFITGSGKIEAPE